MEYIVESDFMYENHRCIVVFGTHGFRCGYVGVDENSPLYGMEATDCVEVDLDEFKKQPIGKRGVFPLLAFAFREEKNGIPLSAYFDVHGGLTYADGNFKYPVKSVLWWFGFDCGHCDDGVDIAAAKRIWKDNQAIFDSISILEKYNAYENFPVRSKEYCEEECKNLVHQIMRLEHELKIS